MTKTALLVLIASTAIACDGGAGPSATSAATSVNGEVADPSAAGLVSAGVQESMPFVVIDVETGTMSPLPESITSIEQIADLTVSPDGSRFVFTGLERVEHYSRQIFVADIDGTHVRQLTDGPPVAGPSWSPDGSSIVYEVAPAYERFSDIVAIDIAEAAGRAVERIDASGRAPRNPSVLVGHASPSEFWQVGARPSFDTEGGRILFTQASGNGRLDLRTISAEGGESSLLIRNAAYGAFSPDGTTIAYQRTRPSGDRGDPWPTNLGIWLADADGSHRRPLHAWSVDRGPTVWKHIGPAWSPDGTRIAYLAPRGGHVHVVDIVTGGDTDLEVVGWPRWVDDRALIVEGYGEIAPAFSLADLAGIWFTVDDPDPGRQTSFLFIKPDGVYSLVMGGGETEISPDQSGTVSITGDEIRFVHEPTVRCPAGEWRLRHVSLSVPDQITGRVPQDHCIWGPNAPILRRITGDLVTMVARSSKGAGSARMDRADVVGTWTSGGTSWTGFTRYAADGSFATFYGVLGDPGRPEGTPGFMPDERGSWDLRNGRLRLLFDGGRTCIAPDGSMSIFNTYSDRPHRLQVMRVRWTETGVMSLTTLRDECYDTAGGNDRQLKLYPPARRPSTTLATLASGTWESLGGTPTPWELTLFRDDLTRRLCIGEGHSWRGVCGPEDDPVPGWVASMPDPLEIFGGPVGLGFNGDEVHSGWGSFRDPVVEIRVEVLDASEGRWRRSVPETFDLPARFGDPFTVFAAHCRCDGVRVLGLDRQGNVIATERT